MHAQLWRREAPEINVPWVAEHDIERNGITRVAVLAGGGLLEASRRPGCAFRQS